MISNQSIRAVYAIQIGNFLNGQKDMAIIPFYRKLPKCYDDLSFYFMDDWHRFKDIILICGEERPRIPEAM